MNIQNPRLEGLSITVACCLQRKARTFVRALILNMAVTKELTRFARPTDSLFAARSGCPTGCRPLSNPQSRVLITPAGVLHAKKKPAFSCELFFKYGGEGGIDSLRSPFGQPTHCVRGLSNWLSPVVEPSVKDSHPSLSGEYKRKKPVLSYELSS